MRKSSIFDGHHEHQPNTTSHFTARSSPKVKVTVGQIDENLTPLDVDTSCIYSIANEVHMGRGKECDQPA